MASVHYAASELLDGCAWQASDVVVAEQKPMENGKLVVVEKVMGGFEAGATLQFPWISDYAREQNEKIRPFIEYRLRDGGNLSQVPKGALETTEGKLVFVFLKRDKNGAPTPLHSIWEKHLKGLSPWIQFGLTKTWNPFIVDNHGMTGPCSKVTKEEIVKRIGEISVLREELRTIQRIPEKTDRQQRLEEFEKQEIPLVAIFEVQAVLRNLK